MGLGVMQGETRGGYSAMIPRLVRTTMVRKKLNVHIALRVTGAFTFVTAFDLEDFLVRPFKWQKEKSMTGTSSRQVPDGAGSTVGL